MPGRARSDQRGACEAALLADICTDFCRKLNRSRGVKGQKGHKGAQKYSKIGKFCPSLPATVLRVGRRLLRAAFPSSWAVAKGKPDADPMAALPRIAHSRLHAFPAPKKGAEARTCDRYELRQSQTLDGMQLLPVGRRGVAPEAEVTGCLLFGIEHARRPCAPAVPAENGTYVLALGTL